MRIFNAGALKSNKNRLLAPSGGAGPLRVVDRDELRGKHIGKVVVNNVRHMREMAPTERKDNR